MKNKNRKINLYTQGQRVAARVLFMVVLLGNCGLGNVLAAPKGKEVTAVSVSEAKPGSLWERLASRLWSPRQQETHRTPAGPVAEGVTKGAIKAISERDASNVGDLDTLFEATEDKDENIRYAAVEALGKLFEQLNATTDERRGEVLTVLQQKVLQEHEQDSRVREAAVEAIYYLFWFLNAEQRNQTLQAFIAPTNALDTTELILGDTVRFFEKLACIGGEEELTIDEKELIISALDKVESTTWAGIHASEVLSKLRQS